MVVVVSIPEMRWELSPGLFEEASGELRLLWALAALEPKAPLASLVLGSLGFSV